MLSQGLRLPQVFRLKHRLRLPQRLSWSYRLMLPQRLRLNNVLRLPCRLIEAAKWIEADFQIGAFILICRPNEFIFDAASWRETF